MPTWFRRCSSVMAKRSSSTRAIDPDEGSASPGRHGHAVANACVRSIRHMADSGARAPSCEVFRSTARGPSGPRAEVLDGLRDGSPARRRRRLQPARIARPRSARTCRPDRPSAARPRRGSGGSVVRCGERHVLSSGWSDRSRPVMEMGRPALVADPGQLTRDAGQRARVRSRGERARRGRAAARDGARGDDVDAREDRDGDDHGDREHVAGERERSRRARGVSRTDGPNGTRS